MTTTTIVSGYWVVKGKHSSHAFQSWFQNTLRINCPYIFFGNQETIDIVKKVRHDLPTEYCLLELSDFYTAKYKDHLAPHEVHVPSAEVCMIWLEKMFLMQKAVEMNPFGSEYYVWVDAGICSYRDASPGNDIFPCEGTMESLPKDKFIFTSSDEPYLDYCVHENNYYHYISGTAFACHREFIDQFIDIYKEYLEKIITHYNWVNTEQKIFTHMYAEHPELFFKLGQGYGELVPLLYSQPPETS